MAYHAGCCIFLPWFDWTKVDEIPVKTVRKYDQFSTFRGWPKTYPENEGDKVERLKAAEKRVFATLGAAAPEEWGMPDDEFRVMMGRYIDNVPTRTVEIGNEVGMAAAANYFDKLPIASEVLRAAGRRVNLTAPYPTVVTLFLEEANRRKIWNLVDGVCLHPYAANPDAVLNMVRNVRAKLDGWGVHKPLNLTEFGWGTKGDLTKPSKFLVVSEATQRDYIARTFQLLKANAEAMNLGNCLWFAYRDYATAQGELPPNHWLNNCGVIRHDYSRKPSYEALKGAA